MKQMMIRKERMKMPRATKIYGGKTTKDGQKSTPGKQKLCGGGGDEAANPNQEGELPHHPVKGGDEEEKAVPCPDQHLKVIGEGLDEEPVQPNIKQLNHHQPADVAKVARVCGPIMGGAVLPIALSGDTTQKFSPQDALATPIPIFPEVRSKEYT